MKNALSLKMGHSLSMTPALQQAIKLLQMASIDLQAEIQDALDSNLMLEPDDGDAGGGADEREATADNREDHPDGGFDDSRASREAADDRERGAADERDPLADSIPGEIDEDFSWNDVYSGGGQDSEAQQALQDYRQASMTAATDLHGHVLEQLQLAGLTPSEQQAAAFLLDALDERGYVPDYPALVEDITRSAGVAPATVDRALSALQQCEPPGVGARDLGECLQLQLRLQPADATRDLALHLVSVHLAALARTPVPLLARQLGVETDAIEAALARIRRLQPQPGTAFSDHESQYVSPDLFVRKRGDAWEVHLNPEIAPRIRINRDYQSYVRRGDASAEQQTLKQHLAEARHFLHALRSRNDTLLRVGQQIVDLQRGFLEYGPEAMKPLVLRDIAERVGLHESTVSRATASKYMHTPRGLYELKFFFSSAVNQAEGGTCSATAIQAMIKRFVGGESPAKPLSDARLAQMLQDEGVTVARRTIAKYRETLNIPPTHERRVRQ